MRVEEKGETRRRSSTRERKGYNFNQNGCGASDKPIVNTCVTVTNDVFMHSPNL